MTRFLTLIFVVFCAFAQDVPAASSATEETKKVLSILIDRVGFHKDVNYGVTEFFQVRNTEMN